MSMRGSSSNPNTNGLLFVLRNADLTLTTDQSFSKLFNGTNYYVTDMLVKRVTGAYGTACVGGVYTAAAKGGQAIVAAVQSYAQLTGAGKIQPLTLAAILGTDIRTEIPILSLTTGNTGALTADFFIYGFPAD